MNTVMMVQPPQARDTVAHVDNDGPSTLLIFLLIVGVVVAAYFIWRAVQKNKELPPPTTPKK